VPDVAFSVTPLLTRQPDSGIWRRGHARLFRGTNDIRRALAGTNGTEAAVVALLGN
jgi:hypothetical protein